MAASGFHWKQPMMALTGVSIVLLVLAACGDDDEGRDDEASGNDGAGLSKSDVVFHHTFSPSGQHVPIYMAQLQGFFEEEGLNVEMRSGSGSGEVLGVLAAGQEDFVYAGSDSALTLISQGAPIRSVLDIWATHPAVLYALPDVDFDEPSDLVGKKLLEEAGSGDDIRNSIFMERNGVDRSEVDIVTLGQVEAVDALLIAGQVDVVQGFINDTTIAIEAELGEEVPKLLMADHGLNTVARGIFVNQSLIDENPDTIEAFVRAMIRAYLYTRDNIDESVDAFVAEFPENDPELIRKMVVATLDLVDFDNFGFHNEELFQETQDLLVEAEAIENPPEDVTVYFTNEFLPDEPLQP